MIAVRLRVVWIPQTLVWLPPSNAMIAISNFARIIAPVPVSVIIVALLLVIWTTMTAAFPLTAAFVAAFAAAMVTMSASIAAVDGRCCTRMVLPTLLGVMPI